MELKITNKRKLFTALLSTLLMILYAQFILGHYSRDFRMEGSANSLGLNFGYSSADVLSFVEARTNEQLNSYLHFLRIWDALFPILYTLMYVLWITYLFKPNSFLMAVPLLHMLSDWTENILEISLISEYMHAGTLNETFLSAGSSVTKLKWILSVVTYLLLLYGMIIKLKLLLKAPGSK